MSKNKTIFEAIKEDQPIDILIKDIRKSLQAYKETNNEKIRIDVNTISYNSERKIGSIV